MSEIVVSEFGEIERATLSIELLRLAVAIMDALGFEAQVYQDGGKRLAHVYKLEEFNLSEALELSIELKDKLDVINDSLSAVVVTDQFIKTKEN